MNAYVCMYVCVHVRKLMLRVCTGVLVAILCTQKAAIISADDRSPTIVLVSYMIVDEAHRLKSQRSVLAKALLSKLFVVIFDGDGE